MERRLSAIMAADVVGYSRLMGMNEVQTLTSLKQHRAELIDPTIAKHQGRIVKLTGDGMLCEFPSVVNAVECAMTIQRGMRVRNGDVPEDRRIEFRIGVNLGDVIVDDDDIFGDGVNVASRIEGIAKTGGISVSSAVRDNIGNKLDFVFEDMGDQQLKNITFPVRVYNVVLGAMSPKKADKAQSSSPESEKPSIAVLPFNNMSDDPQQEYFSDGITEDIITDLSKVSGLFVVGRNTSFLYKGKTVQLQEVAKELGVKFVLEGSVRKAGDRVRVNGQLIDGLTGGHVWADRYDRDLDDIFAIQDEITQSIVEQLRVRLLPTEKKAITEAPTGNVEAYNLFLRGRHYMRHLSRRTLFLARGLFEQALALDPNFARAAVGVALANSRLVAQLSEPIPAEQMLIAAQRAVEMDADQAEAQGAFADTLGALGRDDEAQAAFEFALGLEPNNFDVNFMYARFCFRRQRFEEAKTHFLRALEEKQEESMPALFLSLVLRKLGKAEEAKDYARIGLKRAEEEMRLNPENSRPAQIGACVLADQGETERAKRLMERALLMDPDDNLALYNAACMWTSLGEIDDAITFLERSRSTSISRENFEWMKVDPDLEPLHGHPRFQAMIEAIDEEIEGAVA